MKTTTDMNNQSENQKILSHKNLNIWIKSMDLVEMIYRITEKLPIQEKFGLRLQMRKSAVSVPSNIAEGYGRNSTGYYKHFLSISRGSLLELETQLLITLRLNYLNQNDVDSCIKEINILSSMIYSLISKLK